LQNQPVTCKFILPRNSSHHTRRINLTDALAVFKRRLRNLAHFAYSFLMLGVAALGVVLLIRKLRKTRLLGGAVKLQKPFVTAILNVGMLLFLSCCIVLFIIGM